MDVHNKKTRSYNMSRIRSKDTRPEMIIRKRLHSKGFRYRLHDKSLPGKPDIVLVKYKIVIDVRGCFWHGHEGCNYYVQPKSRSEFWIQKIKTNKERDRINEHKLSKLGWKVFIIWECELKNAEIRNSRLNDVLIILGKLREEYGEKKTSAQV